MHQQGHFKVKYIHWFASEYLMAWFPEFVSYQVFNNRLNRLIGAFNRLVGIIVTDFRPEDCCLDQSLLDSMPIMTCSGKRTGKVAREITNKGYCSTKSVFYYGMKMHLLGFRRIGRLPHSEQILFTPASVSDTSVYKKNMV